MERSGSMWLIALTLSLSLSWLLLSGSPATVAAAALLPLLIFSRLNLISADPQLL